MVEKSAITSKIAILHSISFISEFGDNKFIIVGNFPIFIIYSLTKYE